MNCRLSGISFADLPHLSRGEEVTVVRESGEKWDSDARPAYSVRLNGIYHLGYIPLIETTKEEGLRAKDGYKKKWKDGLEDLSAEELREAARILNEGGEPVYEWVTIEKDKARELHRRKMNECDTLEIVRDWLYVEMNYNHMTPRGYILPLYFDKKEGRNYEEIGDICSISVGLDVEGNGIYDEFATQTGSSKAAEEAARSDQHEWVRFIGELTKEHIKSGGEATRSDQHE